MVRLRADKFFFLLVMLLLAVGFVIFYSASQSLLGRSSGAGFGLVAIKQFMILLVGFVGLIIFSNIPYKHYRTVAFWFFLATVIFNILVFIPGIGFASGGAKRWIDLGFLTFQPSELLKLGFVMYAACWLSAERERIQSLLKGILPFLAIVAVPLVILLKEPDTGTFLVLFAAALGMLLLAGARWKHLLMLVIFSIIAILLLAVWKPYIRDRLETFFDPTKDMQGQSYQINQALIAVGSGGIFGRGFGQSTQKFNFLPEPIGDSIFAVLCEEFGLLGGSILIIIYTLFFAWGIKIAMRVSDQFGRLLAAGLVILISAQAFINISSMLGIIPLTGVPLTFVSHGGSALIIALIEAGIILNISRHQVRS